MDFTEIVCFITHLSPDVIQIWNRLTYTYNVTTLICIYSYLIYTDITMDDDNDKNNSNVSKVIMWGILYQWHIVLMLANLVIWCIFTLIRFAFASGIILCLFVMHIIRISQAWRDVTEAMFFYMDSTITQNTLWDRARFVSLYSYIMSFRGLIINVVYLPTSFRDYFSGTGALYVSLLTI